MATLVASAAAQLSVLLAPEPMLAGSAVKEVIVGTEPFSGGVLDEVVDPQPASPAQANRMRTSEQRSSPGKWSPGELRVLQDESVESVRNPKQTQSIAHRVLAVALRGPSPLGPPASFVHQVLRVIRRSTVDYQSNGRPLPETPVFGQARPGSVTQWIQVLAKLTAKGFWAASLRCESCKSSCSWQPKTLHMRTLRELSRCGPAYLSSLVTTCPAGLCCVLRISPARNKSVRRARRWMEAFRLSINWELIMGWARTS